MNLGVGFEIIRQEAVERAMANFRREQARRARRVLAEQRQAAGERRSVGPRHVTPGPHAGWRNISREEAAAIVARTNPRGALRLIHTLLGGRTVR